MGGLVNRWGPVAVTMAVIFIGSEQPAVRRAPEKVEFLVAKVAHVLEFAALGAALSRAIAPSRGPIPSRAVGFAVAIAALYAASDEYHQTFTPGRTATVRDVGIDVIGALAGGAGYTQIRRNRSRQPAAGLY